MTRIIGALVAVLLLVADVTGCGSEASGAGVASLESESPSGEESDSGSDSGDDKSREEQALEFVECMREHGVDMPDPEFTEGGGMLFRNRGDDEGGPDLTDRETLKKAEEACQDLRPDFGGEFSPEERAAMEDQALEFAECMREEGYDWPDPDFSGGGVQMRLPDGVDPDDPELIKAQDECHEQAGMEMPGRPGGGDDQ